MLYILKNKFGVYYKLLINYLFPFCCFSCNMIIGGENEGLCSSCYGKINFITEPYCYHCGKEFVTALLSSNICGSCVNNPPIFYINRALLKFDEGSKPIIYNLKYYDKTTIAKFLARIIVNLYGQELKKGDIIAPVPMHKIKRLFRMYNPPQLLAIEIGKILNKPVIIDLLIKCKMTSAQVGLTKAQRATNLKASLKMNQKHNINDKIIILIDDVMTTGQTIIKCSKIILNAKAKQVYAFTIART